MDLTWLDLTWFLITILDLGELQAIPKSYVFRI
jgi:hypothetical protein